MATDTADPNMTGDQVNVTLVCRSPTSDIRERKFLLTREAPTIQIGRASKVTSKGYVAASDNAWFDSPVMSRRHAELTARFDDTPTSISIKDVSSMHGTFHTRNDGRNQEQRIDPDKFVSLSNGDKIRFGIDIFRSKVTFPPCSVDFLYEVFKKEPEAQAAAGFSVTVPDDDEEEDIPSENDKVVRDSTPYPGSYADEASHTPGTSARKREQSIDLTREDDDSSISYVRSSSGVIDLTSDAEHEESDVEVDNASPRDNDEDLHAATLPLPPLPHPSECVFALSEVVPVHQEPVVLSAMEPYQSSEHDAREIGDHHDEVAEVDDIQLTDDEDNESVSTDSSLDPSVGMSVSYASDSESDLDDELRSTDHFEEEDNEGLIRMPYTYDDVDDESLSDEVLSEMNYDTESSGFPTSPSPLPSSPASRTSEFKADKDSTAALPEATTHCQVKPLLFDSLPHAGGSHAQMSSQTRQPSPSDAAMFKSRPLIHQPPNDNRAFRLGEKSGKWEFFAARENNRRIMHKFDASVPVSALRETLEDKRESPANEDVSSTQHAPPSFPLPTSPSPFPWDEDVNEDPTGVKAKSVITSYAQDGPVNDAQRSSQPSIPLLLMAKGYLDLHRPRAEVLPALSEKIAGPDYDMTSAYRFQQSKLAAGKVNGQPTRRLPVQDLLAHEPSEVSFETPPSGTTSSLPPIIDPEDVLTSPAPPACLKRCFDDAFIGEEQVSLNYCRADGCRVIKNNFNKEVPTGLVPTDNVEPASVHTDVAAVESAQQTPPVPEAPAPREISRPSKRRRLAEATAYVALGGVALFTALASTAPVL
ncbi:hypothetical protein F4778DRAFT_724247 [Xylariomycetidae sp. FL2044]|nr:hypothetical protein F4778DRAFT_724247 [Xylariomycetidae sp. FL2044]